MTDATDIWGNADSGGVGGDCLSPESDEGTGTQTCNGEGDMLVDGIETAGAVSSPYEQFRFWQHLANAGLIEGNYTGVSGGADDHAIIGTNVPESKFPDGGWSTQFRGDFAGTAFWFSGSFGHTLRIGRENAPWDTSGDLFTGQDAWSVDAKMDDGNPGLGILRGEPWPNCTDATDEDDHTAEYNVTEDEVPICILTFTNVYY